MEPSSSSDSPRYRNVISCCSPKAESAPSSSSTSGCVSADDSFDSILTPRLFANHKLMIHADAKEEDIETAITKCKDMMFNSAQASDERKWLVRYLIELRLRLNDLKEHDGSLRSGINIKGHHFQPTTGSTNKQFCDHCSGVIWSIVQASYVCNNCEYLCHYKCVDNVIRVCAHVVMTERGAFEMSICPQAGLDLQDYKCFECHAPLTFNEGWSEPRLCDYTGMFFCSTCHWNDSAAIPARVVHNWDWEKRPVSRMAHQMLTLAHKRPYIDVEQSNPKLFKYITELEWIHRMRKDLDWIRRYLCACSEGSTLLSSPLFVELGDVNKKYSMSHLEAIKDGTLEDELKELTEKCRSHITGCPLCSGKGYLCEICGNDEVLYPFDSGSIICDKCNSLYHRSCWLRKNQKCIKCARIDIRKRQTDAVDSDQEKVFDIDRFVD